MGYVFNYNFLSAIEPIVVDHKNPLGLLKVGLNILKYLNTTNLAQLARVNKTWYNSVKQINKFKFPFDAKTILKISDPIPLGRDLCYTDPVTADSVILDDNGDKLLYFYSPTGRLSIWVVDPKSKETILLEKRDLSQCGKIILTKIFPDSSALFVSHKHSVFFENFFNPDQRFYEITSLMKQEEAEILSKDLYKEKLTAFPHKKGAFFTVYESGRVINFDLINKIVTPITKLDTTKFIEQWRSVNPNRARLNYYGPKFIIDQATEDFDYQPQPLPNTHINKKNDLSESILNLPLAGRLNESSICCEYAHINKKMLVLSLHANFFAFDIEKHESVYWYTKEAEQLKWRTIYKNYLIGAEQYWNDTDKKQLFFYRINDTHSLKFLANLIFNDFEPIYFIFHRNHLICTDDIIIRIYDLTNHFQQLDNYKGNEILKFESIGIFKQIELYGAVSHLVVDDEMILVGLKDGGHQIINLIF